MVEEVLVAEVVVAVAAVVVDEELPVADAAVVDDDEELSVGFVELAKPPTRPRPRESSCIWGCERIQLLTSDWFWYNTKSGKLLPRRR